MSSQLDPYIRTKLLAFRGRFRWLVFLRGVSCGLLALLGGVLILSLADWLIVMDDRTRYVLSGGMYFSALVITWLTCVRPLLRVLDERELAAMMEREEPALKSRLLSAVELAEEEREHESAQFRRQAQAEVVESLRAVVLERLLPTRLVQTWLIAVAVVILITGLMVAFDSGRTLMVRALMPMMNIDRVSRNSIVILTPEGGNTAVPENDEIEIRIQVRGPKLEEAPLLIAERADQPSQKAVFVPVNDLDVVGEYATTIAVESQDVDYRVHAGDAVSRRYTLVSRQRPQVLRYVKTYTLPDYAARPPETRSGDDGNLVGLIGTKVNLELELNQAVESVIMAQVTQSATNRIQFAPGNEPTRWSLNLELTENSAYKIHLATAEGLGNKSPVEYSIQAEPDLVPTIELTKPGPELTEAPEVILKLEGEAEDDIGLAKIEQMIKINDQDWKPTELQFGKPLSTNAVIAVEWDLLKIKVKPGDIVLTKLAAEDLKGSRTESRPVRLKLDSTLFEAQRIAALQEQRQWTTNLLAAAQKTLDFYQIIPEELDDLVQPGNDAERRAKATEGLKALGMAQTTWQQAAGNLPALIRKARPGREATGYSLVGRLGVQMESDWLERAQLHLRPMEGIVVDPRVVAHAKQLPDVMKSIESAATGMNTTVGAWLAADEAAVALDLLDYIQRAAESMHRVAKVDRNTDPQVWTRLLRRQKSAGRELDVALDVLKKLGGRLPEAQAKIVQALHSDLTKIHSTLSEAQSVEAEPKAVLLTEGERWTEAITGARDIFRPVVGELNKAALQARAKLEQSMSTTTATVDRVRGELQAVKQAEDNLTKAKDNGENVLTAQAALKVTEEQLALEWRIAPKLLRGRARMEESGKASNALFVSDTAQAAAALGAVKDGLEAGRDLREVEAQLKGIADALKTLEAAHELALLENALKNLANRERWEHLATDANSLRPRDWQWLARRLALSPEKLRAVGLAGDAKLNDLIAGPAAQAVAREMKSRTQKAGFFVEPDPATPPN